MQYLTLVFGMALTAAGVLLLFTGWRARRAGRSQQRALFTSAGWILLAASLLPWIILGGSDRGVAFAIMAFMLAGSMLVIFLGSRHSSNGRARNMRESVNGGAQSINGNNLLVRRVWVFLLAGPLSFAVAMAGTAVLYLAWTGSAANRLAVVMLLVPFAWAVLAIYATYDVSLRQRSATVMGLLAACCLAVFMLFPETR